MPQIDILLRRVRDMRQFNWSAYYCDNQFPVWKRSEIVVEPTATVDQGEGESKNLLRLEQVFLQPRIFVGEVAVHIVLTVGKHWN